MNASQLIYTSWKNGNSQKKGYMVYSKSEDITDSEVEDIKTIMRYIPPRGLNPAPSDEEINETFPYSFAYFKLNSGRSCVGMTTYLGKDYSNRYGNYIIYALVFDVDQLDQYPHEFFGEPFIKTYMTEDELNADSPVPPLETIEIGKIGSVLSDDILIDFVNENEEQAAYVISAALQARKERVPLYINDIRENIILWMAVIARVFPLSIAKEIYYSSYVFDHERLRLNQTDHRALTLDIQGVRPDANSFSYQSASKSSKQIVMDAIDGVITEDVEILEIARDLAEDLTIGMEDIEAFGNFLDEEGYSVYTYDLSYAYQFFKLNKYKRLNYQKGKIKSLLDFGSNHLSVEVNTDSALELITILKDEYETMDIEDASAIILYSYRNAGFMSYSIHSLLIDILFKMSEEFDDENAAFDILNEIKTSVPSSYEDLLDYFSSDDSQFQMQLYLNDNDSLSSNLFFARFILKNYRNKNDRREKASELLSNCIENISRLDKSGDSLVKLLCDAEHDTDYIKIVISDYCRNHTNSAEEVTSAISKWLSESYKPNEASMVFSRLMGDSGTIQIAVNIGGEYVRNATNKHEAFWEFYNSNKAHFTGSGAVNLDYILDAYICENLSISDAEEIIRSIEYSYLVNYKYLDLVLRPIESESVRSLMKRPETIIQRAADLAIGANIQYGFSKIISIANAGRSLRLVGKTTTFADIMNKYPVKLINFGKKDYEDYLDAYMYSYLLTVSSKGELIDFVQNLCDKKKDDIFYSKFNESLKQLKKNEKHHWEKMMVLISDILIMKQDMPDIITDYTTYYYRYLKKLNKDDFEYIKTTVSMMIPAEKSTAFFEKSLEKEKLIDKVGGVLKKINI